MGIIKELSTELSNKIAAGEVVERPASVVKELVENAIDAGATMITVRIERGGISRIQVTDNGCGMSREDALACFGRHATSKISTVDDLDRIYTMGFRGEALSSISAVAQVELFTKREQDELGVHVYCTDERIQGCYDEGMANGTTFVVSNIFYNIPARMKFLKKDSTEASYITDLMTRFVLSHPEISFRYLNSRKEVYFSAGDKNLANCVYTVYGRDYAKGVIPVDYTQDYIKIKGLAGNSETTRPNRAYQSFFVNKRYIKSPLISNAVEKAYKNQVMTGKYPMAVLNIDIDASMIDINVHPTKQEVKFSNESDVYTAVLHAVENALYSQHTIPEIKRTKPEKNSAFRADIVKSDDQYELMWEKNKNRWSPADEKIVYHEKFDEAEVIKNAPDSYKCDTSPEYFEKRRKQIMEEEKQVEPFNLNVLLKEEAKVQPDFTLPESPTPFADAILRAKEKQKEEKIPQPEFKLQPEKEQEPVVEPAVTEKIIPEPPEIVPEPVTVQSAVRAFKVIGQVFSTYIIVERDEEMLIIDQHAAHERLKYEEIKRELDKKSVSAQDLLIPVSVNLSPVEYSIFSEARHFFEELGFEADDFGSNSVVVRTAPAYVEYDDIGELLVELIDRMSKDKGKPVSQKAEYAVYTIACKAAIKANHKLDMKELENLVEKIFEIEPINTCPHGRPIIISMTKKEIEKEFKRIL